MSDGDVFIIGRNGLERLVGVRGETPPCVEAKFKRGDIVKVRRNRAVGHFPRELTVLVAVPPGFSPDDAPDGVVGLQLHEYPGDDYRSDCFRPLVDTKTNISLLERLLDPVAPNVKEFA